MTMEINFGADSTPEKDETLKPARTGEKPDKQPKEEKLAAAVAAGKEDVP